MNPSKLVVVMTLAAGILALPASAGKNDDNEKLIEKVEKQLVDSSGKKAKGTLSDKDYILIYYSAHWCPPCRAFTPQLVKFYNENKAKAKFEVLFVSGDKDEDAMKGYMQEASMPWVAVEYKEISKTGVRKFAGSGIPCLVLLDKDRNVVADSYVGEKYLGPRQVLDKFSKMIDKPVDK